MANNDAITTTARQGRLRSIAMLSVIVVGLGGSMFASPASAQSLGDRFKSLFGGKPEEPAAANPPPPSEGAPDLNCPPVSIRAGASTYAVAAPGKQPVGNDLRYQVTITRTARDCTRTGGDITGRIGIQGRVIAGPAGAPGSVEIPLRVAVVQGGVQEKTIATKVYRTTVTMSEDGSVPFSLVAEDMVYPAPPAAIGDSYIFYIGFDPQALMPEPKVAVKRKKK
jgi:hypothetical protein